VFFQLVVARGKLTKDSGDADAARLNPLEAAQIINLLLRYYTARLPRGVDVGDEFNKLQYVDGKLLGRLIDWFGKSWGMLHESGGRVFFIPFTPGDIEKIKDIEVYEGSDAPLNEGLDTENASYALTVRVMYKDGSESRFTIVSFCVSTTKTPIEIPSNDNAAPDPNACIPHVVVYPSTPSVNLEKYRECMEKASESGEEEEPEGNEEDEDKGGE
jgi:hypothetical protein